MGKHKKKLFWGLIILLLFVPPCYYLKSSFVARKARLERERLLVRREITKPLQPTEGEEEPGPDRWQEELKPPPLETPGEGPVPIPKIERRKGVSPRRIEAKKEKPVVVGKKEIIQRERKPLVQRPPVGKEEMVEPKGKEKELTLPEKPVVPPLGLLTLAECEGVPISHRNLAFLLCKGLHLGSNLSYDQAVMALHGLAIFPRAGWNQGDPSFPIGADELEEILSKAEKAISIGLVAADYPELTQRLGYYCKRERAGLLEIPQCEGPMVTECKGCEISQGDLAIYLCRVLGIGEDLNYDQSLLALAALGISPERGWRFEEPFTLVTQMEIEEVRCSVREAYQKGLIGTDSTLMVVSVNDYCLWLKMNVEVVAEGTVAETIALSDYQGGSRIAIPDEGIVASVSE